MNKKIWICILIFFSGCASAFFPTVEELEQENQLSAKVKREDLKQGRSLSIIKCADCHQLIAPQERSPEIWEKVLPNMIERAKLQPKEGQVLQAYILTACKIQ